MVATFRMVIQCVLIFTWIAYNQVRNLQPVFGMRTVKHQVVGDDGSQQQNHGSEQHRDENELRTSGSLDSDQGGGTTRRLGC